MRTVLATLDGRPIFLAQPEVGEDAKPNESTGANGDGNGEQSPPSSPFGGLFFPLMIGMIILFIFLSSSGRKQKKKQQEMLDSVTKGAKIVTIGGIKGSVVEVRDDEIVVKVDENNNTRMKFSRDAVRTVVGEASGKDAKDDKEEKSNKDKK